jgi:hypothetical protein
MSESRDGGRDRPECGCAIEMISTPDEATTADFGSPS